MICENCGKEHDGSYGSGRFCSKSCAIAFGNKQRVHTSEMNKKTSETLKKFHNENKKPKVVKEYNYICEKCGESFITNTPIRKNRHIYCNHCKRHVVHLQNLENISSIMDLSKRTISKILHRANAGCSLCGWNESTCDIHHIIQKKHGGSDDMDNLILVCPNCHRIIHTKGKYTQEDLQQHSLDKTLSNWKEYYNKIGNVTEAK